MRNYAVILPEDHNMLGKINSSLVFYYVDAGLLAVRDVSLNTHGTCNIIPMQGDALGYSHWWERSDVFRIVPKMGDAIQCLPLEHQRDRHRKQLHALKMLLALLTSDSWWTK